MRFHTRLVDRQEIADNTYAFYFEKPDDFTFKPGQYVQLTLLNPPKTDDKGDTRDFSLASAPYEGFLMIVTRKRDSALKEVLKDMPLGTEVEMKGPYGSFTLQHNSQIPAVMLAGGIGVTPFRSMILHAHHQKLPHKIFLFYANKRPEDAVFLNQLSVLQNEQFTMIPVMTQPMISNRKWEGETGHITVSLLQKYIDDLSKSIFYVVGPPDMVDATEKMLLEADINPDNIKIEHFGGY